MSKFLIVLTTFFVHPIFGAFATSECRSLTTSCEAYPCVEKALKCGPAHYLQAFGGHYCESFLKEQSTYSPEVQEWLPRVRVCLQEKLLQHSSCAEIERKSPEDHVACYESTHFCELSLKDRNQIYWAMKGALLDPQIWAHAASIEGSCLEKTLIEAYSSRLRSSSSSSR